MQRVNKSTATKSRRFCSVPQCHSYCTKGVAIHFFPKDEKLKTIWQHTLRIGNQISKYMAVCSKHFVKSDYMPITDRTLKLRLKRGAIPSQNIPKGNMDLYAYENGRFGKKRIEKSDKEENAEIIILKFSQPSPTELAEKSSEIHHQMETVSKSVDQSIQTDQGQFTHILESDEGLNTFAGVNSELLEAFVQCLKNTAKIIQMETEDLKFAITLILVKLKTNISFTRLSTLMNTTPAKCRNLFNKFTPLLAQSVRSVIYWPTQSEILSNLPACFDKFNNTRVAFHYIEIRARKSKKHSENLDMSCPLIRRRGLKFLIGITPSGLVSFISKRYGTRATRKSIFFSEQLLEKLDEHDAIMIDKGILTQEECDDKLIEVIHLPVKKKTELESEAALESQLVKARVHIDTSIERIRMYRILNEELEWYLVPHIEDIMTIISATINMSTPF